MIIFIPMKKFLTLKYLFVLVAIILVNACSKQPIKVLTNKNGEWKVTKTIKDLFTGITTVEVGKYNFRSDNTGSLDFGGTASFTWACDSDGNRVSINFGQTHTYEISEAKLNSEKWKEVLIICGGNSSTPADAGYDLSLYLERVK